MKSEIDGVVRRTRRYWYADGFAELASGGLMVLAGIGLAAAYRIFAGLAVGSLDLTARCMVVLVVVVVAQALALIIGRGMRGGIEAAKERITYPRTGYVAYRQPQPRPRSLRRKIGSAVLVFIFSLVSGGVLGYVMGALVSSGQVPIWLLSMPVSLGAMVAVVLGLLGRQMALPRFYGLAMISLLVGVLSALGSVEFVGAMFFLVLMGAILLASGGLTLWRYTRQAPPPVEMEDEHGG